VVLSSTINWPGRALRATVSVAARTYDMSGSRVLASGVGTAIEIASISARRPASDEATSRPDPTNSATAAAGTSLMCDPPPLISATTRSLTS
jgi:hypothetical protein